MNINKLYYLLNEKGKKADLLRKTGITRPTLESILNGGDFKVSNLEKIAEALNVNVGYFFDEDIEVELRSAGRDYVEKGNIEHKGPEYVGNNSNSIESDLREQIAQLRSQLADKDKIIALYERDSK